MPWCVWTWARAFIRGNIKQPKSKKKIEMGFQIVFQKFIEHYLIFQKSVNWLVSFLPAALFQKFATLFFL